LAVLALAVVVLGLIQVLNLAKLPFIGILCSPTGSIFSSGALSDFLSKYGYASLFALMAAESASAPIPSEIVMPVAGYLVYEGALSSLALTLVVSLVAAIVGALFDYFLARRLGRPFVLAILRAFRLEASRLDRAEKWFDKSGQWTVFAARFVPLVRALISLPAGLFRMSLVTFLVMTTAGCLIWNGILLYAGFSAGGAITNACSGPSANLVVTGFSAAAVLVAAGYLVYFGVASRWNPKESKTV
jgi:membrane protein DedA with SNARE-associated domain